MKKEDILALDEFRETYGDKAADALVQYLTKKRKDLTAHEVLEDDGAFERFSNWAYTKLHVDVYEKFAKHDVGGFFKRSNVEGFRKMRPGVDPNYNYFLKDFEKESSDVDDISQLDDREIAKTIANQFKSITNVDISDIFNTDSSEPDTPLFNQNEIDKTMPSIRKWLDSYGIPANRQDDILCELDDVLSTKFQEMDEDPLVIDSLMSNESIIGEDDKISLTFGQLKKLVREFREKLLEDDEDDYEVCAKCGAEIDPCDAYYVDASEVYCSEDCLNAAGYTLDDVIDDTEIDKSYESKIGEELEDKDISKVYDELKKTGKKDDEIGKVIGGMMTSNESSDTDVLENNPAMVETAVKKFNALRKQALDKIGDEDSLYYETGSTIQSAPGYVSEMTMDIKDGKVFVRWTEDERLGWKTRRVEQENVASVGDDFEIDNILDSIDYMMKCIKRAMKYYERVNPDNEEEVVKQLEQDDEFDESVKYFSRQKMFQESTLDTPAYWNNNGKYQDLANRVSGVSVEDLIEKFKIPYSIASKFDRDRFQYFRFFNDGDMPTIFKRDIYDKFGEFPKYCDMNDDELFNFVAQRLEALIDADLNVLKPFLDKVPEDDKNIEETVVLKKQLIIGDNNDGTITLMMTVQPSEDDKKMLRMLAGDESIDFKKDPEYSYWYASIKGKTPKEAEEQISSNFQDYAIEIDNDQDQISL